MICFMVFRLGRFLYRTMFGVMSGFQLTIGMPRWVYALDDAISGWRARR
jgi:hypothetical protein